MKNLNYKCRRLASAPQLTFTFPSMSRSQNADDPRNHREARRETSRYFSDTRVVMVYRIDRRTANVWGEWSSYPADKGTASINYDATLQGKSPVQETSYVRLRSLPPNHPLPRAFATPSVLLPSFPSCNHPVRWRRLTEG